MTETYRSLFQQLLDAYGPQHWWPADNAFEMMLGAILIQHTAWPNASRAIENLRGAGRLTPESLEETSYERLCELIRPAGVYRIKAQRIHAYVRWYRDIGEWSALNALPTSKLRHLLLSVHGVGPETADDILVYAFHRPVFVVDAYARRLFSRYGIAAGDERYGQLRTAVERAFPGDAAALGEFHALIVEHGKRSCRRKPLCGSCALKGSCAYAMNSEGNAGKGDA